jgi:sigma-B regulation protein RsbU (phosphoserine phosphatase)
MADLNEDAVHDLGVLVEVACRLGETFELDPLLKTIEQAGLSALSCERATVFLYDPECDELYSRVATGTSEIRFPAGLGIAGEAAQTRKVIHVPDAYADPRFNADIDRRTGYRTRNLLTVPLVAPDGQLMGVLQALNKRSGAFVPADEAVAAALGALTGVAIKRQMLLDAAAIKQRLERELDIARQIQQQLLPKKNPVLPGFEMAGWNRPADSTGGDCYDFFLVDDERLALVVADATGHGIGPALIMTQCRALLRAVSQSSYDLSQIARRVNNLLCSDLPSDRFVTVFHGLLDAREGCVKYVSAGHGPMLHFKAATGEIRQFGATGLPMGIVMDADMPCGEPIMLAPGDLFVVLTDGFIEWPRSDGELYGEARMEALLRRHCHERPERLIEILHQDVKAFSEGTPQGDDLTVVVVKRV